MRKIIALFSVIGLALSLAACAGSTTTADRADRADDVELAWALARLAPASYVAGCKARPTSSVCSAGIVDATETALKGADVAVAAAVALMRNSGTDMTARQKARAVAMAAIAGFTQLWASFGVSTTSG